MYIKDTSSAINIYMKMKSVLCFWIFYCSIKYVMICISNWKCAHWEPWSEGTFQSIFDCCNISNPTGESIWDAHMTHLCLVITPVSGLFAYSACRHGLGEAPAFKSLVHHSHFRIWTPWRLSWNAFMACCGLLDRDQLRLCRKQGIQDGVQCCLHNPAR